MYTDDISTISTTVDQKRTKFSDLIIEARFSFARLESLCYRLAFHPKALQEIFVDVRKALDTHMSGRKEMMRDEAGAREPRTVDSGGRGDALIKHNAGRVMEGGGSAENGIVEIVMREEVEKENIAESNTARAVDQDELSRHLAAAIQSMTQLPSYFTATSPFDDDAVSVYRTLVDEYMNNTNSLLSLGPSSLAPPANDTDGYVLIKRIQITPSRVIAKPAISMKTSRLIRGFGDDYHLGKRISLYLYLVHSFCGSFPLSFSLLLKIPCLQSYLLL
jgi:hypothetical protein